MRICVIGCGAAGLAVLRIFSEEIAFYPKNWELSGFERTGKVGGVWNYSEDISDRFITPLYNDLKTNLPKEVMAFPDFPFSNEYEHSFIHHSEVLSYLRSYSIKYDLEKFIEYNSNIKSVEPINVDNDTYWEVTITNTITSSDVTRVFDAVIVANGHFDEPFMPEIKGIENFKGECIHSKYYRIAENYRNKTVFILGARNSGIDIAFQLAQCTQKVYLAHNQDRKKFQKFLEIIHETYGINEIDFDGRICTLDGSKFDADVIICCTGFITSLDFLSESCKIQYDNSYVRPLYNHLISPYYPSSLFFVGLGYEITPFTFFYMQSKVIRAVIQNCTKGIVLETQSLLEAISKQKEQFEEDNVLMRHRHYMNLKQWPYIQWCEFVAEEMMTSKVPKHLEALFNIVKKWRVENVTLYREINIELSDENNLGFIIKNGPTNDFYTADFEDYLRNVSLNN